MPAKQTSEKAPIFFLYLAVIGALVLGVFLFALLYGGSGADALRNPSEEFTEALQKERALDILATPAPTRAPVAASTAGRIIPYYENGLWGYKNTLGQVVIKPAYTKAAEFDDGVAFVAAENGLYGLLSLQDVMLVDPCWDGVLPFSDGYAAVSLEGKWGYIDTTGKVVIDYQFREAGSFHCGRAMTRSGSAYGYIDIYGNYAVSTKWRKAGDFSEDLAFTTSDEYEKDRHYIIDKVGEKVAKFGSSVQGTVFSEGYAVVVEDGKTYYYINSTGRSAFRQTFLDARPFSNGLAAVKTAEGWGYINDLGSFAIPAQFTDARDFSADGLAAVLESATGKWGYIDKKGNMVIDPAYDSAEAFSESYAIASVAQEYYLLDLTGKAKLFYTM